MGTKKGQVRKTARRAYVSKRGKGPKRQKGRVLDNRRNNTYAIGRIVADDEDSRYFITSSGKIMDFFTGMFKPLTFRK